MPSNVHIKFSKFSCFTFEAGWTSQHLFDYCPNLGLESQAPLDHWCMQAGVKHEEGKVWSAQAICWSGLRGRCSEGRRGLLSTSCGSHRWQASLDQGSSEENISGPLFPYAAPVQLPPTPQLLLQRPLWPWLQMFWWRRQREDLSSPPPPPSASAPAPELPQYPQGQYCATQAQWKGHQGQKWRQFCHIDQCLTHLWPVAEQQVRPGKGCAGLHCHAIDGPMDHNGLQLQHLPHSFELQLQEQHLNFVLYISFKLIVHCPSQT